LGDDGGIAREHTDALAIGSKMTILSRNRDSMATLFERDGQAYLTVVAGGVGQYEITLKIQRDDLEILLKDENKLIAFAKDVATRTAAYEDRLVNPPIDPI